MYAIRRSRFERFTVALIFAIGLGSCIWMSGRVDWGVGKVTDLSTFLLSRGVPYDWARLLDPSNPTPLVVLIWFLLVAALSIAAVRSEQARGADPARWEFLMAGACAVASAAGWVLRPQHYEESARVLASSLAMLLATFAFVILQRAARAHLQSVTLDRVMSALVALMLLRSLTLPNPSGFASERLRSMTFNLAPIRSYLLPLAAEASWIAAGALILVYAVRQKRRVWMGAGFGMAISGSASSLTTLEILSGRAASLAFSGAQVLLCAALATLFVALFVSWPERESDRDIMIPVVRRDTA